MKRMIKMMLVLMTLGMGLMPVTLVWAQGFGDTTGLPPLPSQGGGGRVPPPPLPNLSGAGGDATGLPLVQVPQPTAAEQVNQQIQQQSLGQYPVLDRSPSLPLGTLQRAWDAPYAASGQVSPGVIRYTWNPDLVMAVRMREFMMTTIHLPTFEKIGSVIIGDPVVFDAQQIKPNVVGIRPNHAGADSNLTILGVSGNVYSFYVRSEGFNTDQISDITVYVEASRPGASVFQGTEYSSGSSAMMASTPAGGGTMGDIASAVQGRTSTAGAPIPDYIRQIAFRPETLRFDMTILAPTPQDAEIAPLRVFHDGIWTYFDFGDKVDSMRRPVVHMIVDEVDTLINTRTAGPKGNLLIAEAVGDFTLRNGNRVICVYRNESLRKAQSAGSNGAAGEATGQDIFTVNPDQLVVLPNGDTEESRESYLENVSSWFQ